MQKRVTLNTRPFQPLFLAAEDLLKLARPYFDEVKAFGRRFEETKTIDGYPQQAWQKDKSLSIGSFLVKYAGLEALVNCTHNDFKMRDLKELQDKYLTGPLNRIKNKLQAKPFSKWRLSTRVFLLVPLCSDTEIDPCTVFDISGDPWKKFEETIEIRHSFSHAKSAKIEWVLTQSAPKFNLIDDKNPDNFWPITKTDKDIRSFGFDAASRLNSIIDWIVSRLREALPDKLTDIYYIQEKVKTHNS